MRQLLHLTINTGHVRQSPRSEVDQKVIDMLLPMIDNEAGGFPKLGIGFDLFRPLTKEHKPIDGAAVVNIVPWPMTADSLPYATLFCCWNEDMDEQTWSEAESMVDAYRDVMEQAGHPKLSFDKPNRTPWLAVMLFPTIASLDPDRVEMMGDMERCLFWALAEGSK